MPKICQDSEDQVARLMNTPTVRIVERAGVKLIQEVGNNNPWSREWSCTRRTCLPCQGQAILGAEEEEAALKMADGDQEDQRTARWPREDIRSLPGCTSEGCNYVLECLQCRKDGIKRR